MENDRNLGQIVDSEWRRKACCVAKNNAISALLLENFDPKKIGMTFPVTDVDMKRADISDSKSTRPMAVFHIL